MGQHIEGFGLERVILVYVVLWGTYGGEVLSYEDLGESKQGLLL